MQRHCHSPGAVFTASSARLPVQESPLLFFQVVFQMAEYVTICIMSTIVVSTHSKYGIVYIYFTVSIQ